MHEKNSKIGLIVNRDRLYCANKIIAAKSCIFTVGIFRFQFGQATDQQSPERVLDLLWFELDEK